MIIACLGLYGLTSYDIETRTKEIGVRRVLGAERFPLILLSAKKFSPLIMMGTVSGLAIGHLAATYWLEHYAYRTELYWWIYAFPAVVIGLFTITIVATKTLATLRLNPVETLRYE
jgi:putative ABC transport system permease protein